MNVTTDIQDEYERALLIHIVKTLMSSLERLAPIMEEILNEVALQAISEYYGTYPPSKYIRTYQLPLSYDIAVNYRQTGKYSCALDINGRLEPTINSMGAYYSIVYKRLATPEEMTDIVYKIDKFGIRPMPPWICAVDDWPTYGPISVDVPELDVSISGSSVTEIVGGKELWNAMKHWAEEQMEADVVKAAIAFRKAWK